MPKSERISLLEDCRLCAFPPRREFSFSSVGDDGVDKYFREEAVYFAEQKLAKNYCFVLNATPQKIVCAFSVSNDGIQKQILTNNARRSIAKNIPFIKAAKVDAFPAVLIGQLGIAKDFQQQGIGSELLNFIKVWLSQKTYLTEFRFLLVDANRNAVDFYKKNGFALVYKEECAEKKAFGIDSKEILSTRFMRFDIKDASVPPHVFKPQNTRERFAKN